MEIEQSHILPLDLAKKYYQKWDCDVATQLHNQIYYKYLTGLGQVTYLNGNSYHGCFYQGLMHGQGTYKWSNGLIYEGSFVYNHVTGKGKLSWKDGSYYIGQVVEGKRTGQGQYFCAIDKSKYKGSWANGVKEGKGVLHYANGSLYEGQFKQGKRHGQGKMRYPSGNEYEGYWVQDKKQGKGCMHWHTQCEKYEGSWKADLPDGRGVYYWFQNKSDNKNIKTIYKGEWQQGKRHGYGAFFYNNGCRMEGTFSNNLKEGLCALTDQFGDTHIEHYHLDKASSLNSSQKPFKVPDLNKPMIHNSQPTQNTYIKITDIESTHLDEAIFNLLLRQNSHLRSDYKNLISCTNKEIFNGLNIEGLWKMVKQMKISNEWLSIAKINRMFYQGSKSRFEVEMPHPKKIQMLKENPKILEETAYRDIEWHSTFKQIKQMPLDWTQWPSGLPQLNINKVSLSKTLDVHHEDHVILFRHFIVYILHLTLLQRQQFSLQSQEKMPFRKCLENVLQSIKVIGNPVSNMPSQKTEKMYSDNMTSISLGHSSKLSIPHEYSLVNKAVIDQLNSSRSQLINTIDKTVSVKQIYTLLLKCNILKEASEKVLFLERIERTMNVKSSLLRKQNKAYYAGFEHVALTSAHFAHIMNYEMIGIEVDEILYKLLNRKIGNAQSKEDFMKKYKQIINNMVTQLKKYKENISKKTQNVAFKWQRKSTKDKQREELLQKIQEERIRREEEERKQAELRREEWERNRMAKEDSDVKDYEESQQSEQYYD